MQPDPLLSLGYSGTVAGFCTCFSGIGIDKRGFADIRNPDHHGTDRTVFNSTFFVALDFFPACLHNHVRNEFHSVSFSGVQAYHIISLFFKV